MKEHSMNLIFIILLLFSASASAEIVLVCNSPGDVRGWKAVETNEPLRLTAYVNSDGSLAEAQVGGAYESDVRSLQINEKYVPQATAYRNMNRYDVLEDAWHWFIPLLPKNLLSQKSKFTGYLQIMGEEGFNGTENLSCFLVEKIGN